MLAVSTLPPTIGQRPRRVTLPQCRAVSRLSLDPPKRLSAPAALAGRKPLAVAGRRIQKVHDLGSRKWPSYEGRAPAFSRFIPIRPITSQGVSVMLPALDTRSSPSRGRAGLLRLAAPRGLRCVRCGGERAGDRAAGAPAAPHRPFRVVGDAGSRTHRWETCVGPSGGWPGPGNEPAGRRI
jgi:hypothetical protein